ncbi:MAG TPA: (2Fe-2S)-binding protein [Bacillota bacterium]|nr:(2Fe-2S)-binding protein [Bacillota bacterium]
MKNNRITEHPVLDDIEERPTVTFTFDGKEYTGYEGDTIASALLANGVRTLRVHEASGKPRGIYCNIGHCYECRVTVNDVRGVRACLEPVKDGMNVASGDIQPNPLKPGTEPLPRTYAEYEKQQDVEQGDE